MSVSRVRADFAKKLRHEIAGTVATEDEISIEFAAIRNSLMAAGGE